MWAEFLSLVDDQVVRGKFNCQLLILASGNLNALADRNWPAECTNSN